MENRNSLSLLDPSNLNSDNIQSSQYQLYARIQKQISMPGSLNINAQLSPVMHRCYSEESTQRYLSRKILFFFRVFF